MTVVVRLYLYLCLRNSVPKLYNCYIYSQRRVAKVTVRPPAEWPVIDAISIKVDKLENSLQNIVDGVTLLRLTSDNQKEIYDLNGCLVVTKGQSLKPLPRGVYIIGGKKVVVK